MIRPECIPDLEDFSPIDAVVDGRELGNPAVQIRPIPLRMDYIRKHMVRDSKVYGCLFQEALQCLIADGMATDAQDAIAAVITWTQRHPRMDWGAIRLICEFRRQIPVS